jgi:TolB-like protein
METSLLMAVLISMEGVAKVAVLPFGNISGDTSDNWLCLGFAETMSGKLSHAPNLMVVERVYVGKILEEQHFQEGAVVNLENAVQIGNLLGAQKVVIGSFQHFGELVKASAKLVDVETGQVEAAAETKGNYNEVLGLQDALANDLVGRICPEAKEEIVEEEEPKPSVKPMKITPSAEKEPAHRSFLSALCTTTGLICTYGIPTRYVGGMGTNAGGEFLGTISLSTRDSSVPFIVWSVGCWYHWPTPLSFVKEKVVVPYGGIGMLFSPHQATSIGISGKVGYTLYIKEKRETGDTLRYNLQLIKGSPDYGMEIQLYTMAWSFMKHNGRFIVSLGGWKFRGLHGGLGLQFVPRGKNNYGL